MRSITVLGRRWFQRTYGNTYHSAEVLIDGSPVIQTGIHYGYGDQYLYTAFQQLSNEGHIQDWQYPGESPWRWAERNNVTLHYSATDVARERDLR